VITKEPEMSVLTASAPVVLESASQAFVGATAKPPFLYELTPAQARAVLDDVQSAPDRQAPYRGAVDHRAGRRRRRTSLRRSTSPLASSSTSSRG
jgi:hypothetical protein